MAIKPDGKKATEAPTPWLMYLMTGAAGLFMMAMVWYGFNIGQRMNRIDAPLVNAAMKLRLEASITSLMFEELLSGGIVGDIDGTWDRLDYGLEDLLARLSQSERRDGIFRYLRDSGIKENIGAVEEKLSLLKTIMHERFEKPDFSIVADRADLRYDEVFSELMVLLNDLEAKVVEARNQNEKRFRRVHALMIGITVAICALVGMVFHRYERTQTRAYMRLGEANRKLAREMAEREKAQKALKQAHAGLERKVRERTEELSLSNENLKVEISERREAVALLEHHKAMLQAVFDGISDPLILVDRNMRVKTINESAIKSYNLTDGDFSTEKPCYKVIGFDSPCRGCRIPRAVEENRNINFERKGVFNPDRLGQVTIYPVIDGDESTGDAIIHISDITEKRSFERRLMQKEKMAALGILVANVAHEINNPNSFISFNMPILEDYIEQMALILDEHAGKHPDLVISNMPYELFREDLSKLVENIGNGSARIDSFVSKLREYSKRKDKLRLHASDVRMLAKETLDECRSTMAETVETIEEDLPESIPPMMTDPFSMRQILSNILQNAAQAADKENSWVRLRLRYQEQAPVNFTIEISDNGRGMDEEVKQRIFDPFFTTKKIADGSGLGLYMCHNLVEDLGGRIEVESEPGLGSTFRLVFSGATARTSARA